MFDVHFFQSLLGKNNLVLMLSSPLPLPTMDDNSLESPFPILQTLTLSHSRLPPEPGIALTGHPPRPAASGEDCAEDRQDDRWELLEYLPNNERDCEVWRLVAGWRARIGRQSFPKPKSPEVEWLEVDAKGMDRTVLFRLPGDRGSSAVGT